MKFSSPDDWVDFGEDPTEFNTITRYYTWTYFKIRAGINEAGLTKYINWNSLEQDPDEQDYLATMPMTRVEVWDAAYNDVEGTILVDTSMISLFRGTTSIPIEVYMTPGCDTEVILNIEIDTRALHGADIAVNSAERVQLTKTSITWAPWKYHDSFSVSVDADWDVDRPNSFYLKYSLSSTDAAAFRLYSSQTEVFVLYDTV